MDYGFGVPTRGPLATADAIRTIVAEGSAMGFGYMFVNDHLVIPNDIHSTYPYSESGEWPGGKFGEFLETLSLLAFLAALPSSLRMLTAVLVLPHRRPVHTAKALATVDYLSGGRLTIGCGVGWLREEFRAIGAEPFDERGRVADEYIAAFRELWSQDTPEFHGRYADFAGIAFLPKPVQKVGGAPAIPIWIGGESGPALRRAARLGDGWFPIGANPRFPLDTTAKYRAAKARLHAHAADAGRDPAAINLAYSANWFADRAEKKTADGKRHLFTGPDAAIAEDIAALQAEGVRELMLNFQAPTMDETLDKMRSFMADIAPKAA